MTLLSVEHVSKQFVSGGGFLRGPKQRVYAVDDVSFTLQAGETLGIVGESGCGKSTLGRTILRLLEPTSGKIIFDGVDIASLSAKALRQQRKKMQIIFQDPVSSLNPRMRVTEILAEPMVIHGFAKEDIASRVTELLAMVGLPPDSGRKFPHEFSGGQRQRIGIARAIALRPQLIIADEPVSALDVSIQSQILNLLVDLRERLKLSLVFIAHDLAVVEHISDVVAVMYLGRIVEMAPVKQLYERPSHPYTQLLMASIPVIGERRHEVGAAGNGDIPSPMNPPPGCHFHPRCPIATDICRTRRPEVRHLGDLKSAHQVACHHAK